MIAISMVGDFLKVDIVRVMPVVGFAGVVSLGLGIWLEMDEMATGGAFAFVACVAWWGNHDLSPSERRKYSGKVTDTSNDGGGCD
jgi:hypothetical protein